MSPGFAGVLDFASVANCSGWLVFSRWLAPMKNENLPIRLPIVALPSLPLKLRFTPNRLKCWVKAFTSASAWNCVGIRVLISTVAPSELPG